MLAVANAIAERISFLDDSPVSKVAAEAERLRSEGADIVDFAAEEPDFPTPGNIKQAAIRALEQNLAGRTPAGGAAELKEALCWRHARDFGTSYQPEECIVTAGGRHAIFNLTQALVEPGDEVVIPIPSRPAYQEVVRYAGGKCVLVETDSGFALTAAMIERHLTPLTKLVIVNSPANPSGAVLDRAEFEKIFELAHERGIYLLTDECCGHFLYDGKPFSVASLPGAGQTVLVAGSLSNTYAMSGWRIGFGLAPAAIVRALTRLQSRSISYPTSISQKAAVEALRGPQDSVAAMLGECRRRRDLVVGRMRAIPGVQCAEPRGAFYAYPDVGSLLRQNGFRSSAQFAQRLLAEARVAVAPGEVFGTGCHVRIRFATSAEELDRGLDRIQQFFIESHTPR